jgi:hypothetical protein
MGLCFGQTRDNSSTIARPTLVNFSLAIDTAPITFLTTIGLSSAITLSSLASKVDYFLVAGIERRIISCEPRAFEAL